MFVQPLMQQKSSKCVFSALGIRHAMRMRRIVFCGLPCSVIFFHIISLGIEEEACEVLHLEHSFIWC